jgi:hypothetical protein
MKADANSTPGFRLKIDKNTMKRHSLFFQRGDYARIAEMSGVTRSSISDCFKSGTATEEVAKAMKAFYAKKEKMQKSLAA